MGLDMYLHKDVYVKNYDFSKEYENAHSKKTTITVTDEFPDGDIQTKEYTVDDPQFGLYLQLPIMYWRKANAIHRWFIMYSNEDDNCRSIKVWGTDLLELVKLCKQVMDDHSKAPELLPTQDGFFFGGTEYDEHYFDEIERTYNTLKDVKPDDEFTYQASW